MVNQWPPLTGSEGRETRYAVEQSRGVNCRVDGGELKVETAQA